MRARKETHRCNIVAKIEAVEREEEEEEAVCKREHAGGFEGSVKARERARVLGA